jgi:hypothetical protein
LRSLLLGAAVAVLSIEPALADIPCPPFLPNCGFSVSGKKGPYFKQIDPQKLVALDASMKTQSATGAKGLGEHSINQGAITGAGLYMPQTQANLLQLLGVIRAQWPYADPGPVKVRMIGSTTYGPFARPDNTIVIPLGLLERAQSDDEVVWVLAHEFSHLALRHYVRTAELEQHERTMDGIVNMLTTGLVLSQERAQSSGAAIHFYAVNDPGVQQRTQSMQSWQERVRQGLLLRDSAATRDQEDQADAMGADLAIAAGYAADDGAAQAIDGLSEDDARAVQSVQSLRDQMQQAAKQSVTQGNVTSVANGDFQSAANGFLHNLAGNLAAVLTERTLTYLSSNHRQGPARRKGMTNYIVAAYPNLSDRPLKKTWLLQVQSNPDFKAAKTAVHSHDIAENDLANGDPAKALLDIQDALGTLYAGTPYVINTEAKIVGVKGDVATADRLYDQAEGFGGATARSPVALPTSTPARNASHKPHGKKTSSAATAPAVAPVVSPAMEDYLRQNIDGYGEHIDLLAEHGLYDKATRKISEAEARFGDHEAFLPQIIYISLKTKKVEAMMAAYGECLDIEDQGLKTKCRYAILDEDQKKALAEMTPAQREKLGPRPNQALDSDRQL